MQPLSIANGVRSLRKTIAVSVTTVTWFHSASQLQRRTQPRIHHKKKPEPPKPGPWWKPFEVTNVILDLDSYESNYARPYDDAEEEAQVQKWATHPRREAMKKRIDQFEVGREAAKANFTKISETKAWQPWRVTDLDIMTAALKGGLQQSLSQTEVERVQQEVIERNGIPMSVCREDARLLEWLLHRKSVTPTRRPGAEELMRLLEEPTTPEDFHRVFSRMLNADESATILLNNAGIMATVIADALDRRLARPIALLPLLNTFLLRCEKNDYALGLSLCNIGMRISAEAFRLKSLKLYLDHAFDQRYHISPAMATDVLRPLHKLVVHGRQRTSPQLASKADADLATESLITPNFRPLLLQLLEGKAKKTDSSKTYPCFKKIVVNEPEAEDLHVMYWELIEGLKPSSGNVMESVGQEHEEPRHAGP